MNLERKKKIELESEKINRGKKQSRGDADRRRTTNL